MAKQIKIVNGKPVQITRPEKSAKQRRITTDWMEAQARLDNANEERRKMGLPELPAGGEPDEPERDRVLRSL